MNTNNYQKEIFNSLKDFQLGHLKNLSTAAQYWIVYDTFLNWVKPGAMVLDWGCGDGHFSYFLLNKGFDTYSFNANKEDFYNPNGCKLEKFLSSKFKDSFKYQISTQGPVHLPYEDESFDAVVSVGVLEHVRQFGGNEIKSLKAIHRILKKDGLFLCFHFPNKYSWIETLARRIPSKHHHPYLFTRKDIYQLNQSAGLIVEELKGYAFLPRNELSCLPEGLKNNHGFIKFYNYLDKFLFSIFPMIFQNYYFLSRKPKEP